jgi:phage-related tail protein
MTVTLTIETLYIAIIVILMVLQIYQFTRVKYLEKEVKDLWDQIGTLTFSITGKFLEVQKDLNDKQDKNENKRNS